MNTPIPTFDIAEVLVSVDGGALQLVASNDAAAGVEVLLDGTGAWEPFSMDLAALLPGPATASVEVFFSFQTVDAAGNDFPGFYVDDFAIALPEPSMLLQLSTGLAFVAALNRRRRKRTSAQT